jgi:two-component system phosphate regulon response regulator PhoB
MPKETILVVDDEEDILELVEYNLTREGYKVYRAASGEEAFSIARSRQPDLILLDLMLPGVDGLTVCRQIKSDRKTEQIPVIMLTAKTEEADIVAGLELGADDYITKPFSPRVLVARVRAVLRKKTAQVKDESLVKIHEIVLDPARHEVLVIDKPVALTFSEFRILQTLSQRPGFVYTRDQIIQAMHRGGYAVSDRTVDVQVAGLRKKLGPAGKYIETVRGVGYRIKD